MKALATRYLNEIVGLAVLALMAVALIAGQADATLHQALQNQKTFQPAPMVASLDAAMETRTIRADLHIELDLDQLIDVASDAESREALRELIRIDLSRGGSAAE